MYLQIFKVHHNPLPTATVWSSTSLCVPLSSEIERNTGYRRPSFPLRTQSVSLDSRRVYLCDPSLPTFINLCYFFYETMLNTFTILLCSPCWMRRLFPWTCPSTVGLATSLLVYTIFFFRIHHHYFFSIRLRFLVSSRLEPRPYSSFTYFLRRGTFLLHLRPHTAVRGM